MSIIISKIGITNIKVFARKDLQGYLDLFTFVMNPPEEPLEKVELIINMAFSNRKVLRYRDAFSANDASGGQ